jgi:hypothetical protein
MTVELLTNEQLVMEDEILGIVYEVACKTPYSSDVQLYARFLSREIAEKVMDRLIEYKWRQGS